MEKLQPHEMQVLHLLLAKVEDHGLVLEILFDVVLAKYKNNRTDTANAMGVSVRTIHNWVKLLPQKH